jgi:hypothetical protein
MAGTRPLRPLTPVRSTLAGYRSGAESNNSIRVLSPSSQIVQARQDLIDPAMLVGHPKGS